MTATRSSRRGPAWRRAGTAVLLLAALGVTGCAEITPTAPAAYEPATVQSTAPDGPAKVTFTAEAAERVDLRTAVVAARGNRLAVDYAALIYDKSGAPWVFTVVAPQTFVRVPVEIDRIEHQQVLLHRGPPPGARVVTQGAIEVWGAELGISGKH